MIRQTVLDFPWSIWYSFETLSLQRGHIPTGREKPLKKVQAWVRIPLSPPFLLIQTKAEKMSEAETNAKIAAIVRKFIKDQDIHCAETIHQMDHVIENAYEFIEELCDAAGYNPSVDD